MHKPSSQRGMGNVRRATFNKEIGWNGWESQASLLALESDPEKTDFNPDASPNWLFGGRGGIRTHGEFNPTLDFESSAFNRTQPPFLGPSFYSDGNANYGVRPPICKHELGNGFRVTCTDSSDR